MLVEKSVTIPVNIVDKPSGEKVLEVKRVIREEKVLEENIDF